MKNKKTENKGGQKNPNTTKSVAKSKSGGKNPPYENNGIKLCVWSKTENKTFKKEKPPFQIVDGKMKQMRCRHKLVLPKEEKKRSAKIIKMRFDLMQKQAA